MLVAAKVLLVVAAPHLASGQQQPCLYRRFVDEQVPKVPFSSALLGTIERTVANYAIEFRFELTGRTPGFFNHLVQVGNVDLDRMPIAVIDQFLHRLEFGIRTSPTGAAFSQVVPDVVPFNETSILLNREYHVEAQVINNTFTTLIDGVSPINGAADRENAAIWDLSPLVQVSPNVNVYAGYETRSDAVPATGFIRDFTHRRLGGDDCPGLDGAFECAMVADGNPGWDGNVCGETYSDSGKPDSFPVAKNKLAGTRCCSDDDPNLDASACPGNPGCANSAVDFITAKTSCEALNLRLCTETEILSGRARSTGCNFDRTRVWTSTDAACPPRDCAVVADGNPFRNSPTTCAPFADQGLPPSFLAPKSVASAGTRCCGSTGDHNDTSICPPGGGCTAVDFDTAKALCENANLRLCTSQEILQGGRARGSGCVYDFIHVWTADEDACPP